MKKANLLFPAMILTMVMATGCIPGDGLTTDPPPVRQTTDNTTKSETTMQENSTNAGEPTFKDMTNATQRNDNNMGVMIFPAANPFEEIAVDKDGNYVLEKNTEYILKAATPKGTIGPNDVDCTVSAIYSKEISADKGIISILVSDKTSGVDFQTALNVRAEETLIMTNSAGKSNHPVSDAPGYAAADCWAFSVYLSDEPEGETLVTCDTEPPFGGRIVMFVGDVESVMEASGRNVAT